MTPVHNLLYISTEILATVTGGEFSGNLKRRKDKVLMDIGCV